MDRWTHGLKDGAIVFGSFVGGELPNYSCSAVSLGRAEIPSSTTRTLPGPSSGGAAATELSGPKK